MLANIQNQKHTVLLALFIFVVEAMNVFYTLRNELSSGLYNGIAAIAIYWALSLWLINDSKSHSVKWFDQYMDMGMILYVAWVLLLPYYLFKTRGWKALITLSLLFGAYLCGALTSAILHFLIIST